LTASSDFTIFIYDIKASSAEENKYIKKPIQILKHPDMVSTASFKIGVTIKNRSSFYLV